MSDLQAVTSTSASASEEIEIYEEAAGTAYESMLITTDSFEEYSQQLSSSLNKDDSSSAAAPSSTVKSIINEIHGNTIESKTSSSNISTLSGEFGSQDLLDQNADDSALSGDYLHDPDWLNQREHFFVLSSAGKPIYSLHGNEDKLATLYGVMQALVSVVQANQDVIMSIHALGIKFVFLLKGPLILVAASRRSLSVQQIQLQLT